jgi:uncharacterized protein (DUF2267 family)
MKNNMALNFDQCSKNGNEFVKLVANDLQVTKEKAGRFIAAVFHALRRRLTHEESFRLIEHLPFVLKGVYVDGWHFNKDADTGIDAEDFQEQVRHEYTQMTSFFLGHDQQVRAIIKSVFQAMNIIMVEEDSAEILQPLSSLKMN